MKTKKNFCILMTCMALAVVLSGCSKPDASKEIILDDPKEYESIFFTLAGPSDEDDKDKHIKNKKMVKNFVKELDGMELIEPSRDELLEKMSERREARSYQIGLFKPFDVDEEPNPYFLTFYEDGTIMVKQLGNYYFVKNLQPNLLNQLKTEWEINF